MKKNGKLQLAVPLEVFEERRVGTAATSLRRSRYSYYTKGLSPSAAATGVTDTQTVQRAHKQTHTNRSAKVGGDDQCQRMPRAHFRTSCATSNVFILHDF